ncbi:hypothetical protein J6S37_01560 [Candidatus Saccharibacteria bacterium]|nr:hypothetical protein [Candidatus Saccharibacteria bacterium]
MAFSIKKNKRNYACGRVKEYKSPILVFHSIVHFLRDTYFASIEMGTILLIMGFHINQPKKHQDIPPDLLPKNSVQKKYPVRPLEASVSPSSNRDDTDTILKKQFAEFIEVGLAFR